MRGRVYSAWTVDAIGRIGAVTCIGPSKCWWHVTSRVMDHIRRQSRFLYTTCIGRHHLLPLVNVLPLFVCSFVCLSVC